MRTEITYGEITYPGENTPPPYPNLYGVVLIDARVYLLQHTQKTIPLHTREKLREHFLVYGLRE